MNSAKIDHRIMKKVLLIFSLLIPLQGFSQANENDFIFKWPNNETDISIDSAAEKFTPTIAEIGIAKQLSEQYIDSLENNAGAKKVKKSCKILQYKYADYLRQYVGYTDSNGHRIIFMNAVCTSVGKKVDLKNEWIFVLDGGSCFYQIKVDLTTEKCFNFRVNGNS